MSLQYNEILDMVFVCCIVPPFSFKLESSFSILNFFQGNPITDTKTQEQERPKKWWHDLWFPRKWIHLQKNV